MQACGAAWHILEFFVARNVNACNVKASQNLKTEQKCNLGENNLIEMNLLMQKNDPVIVKFSHLAHTFMA